MKNSWKIAIVVLLAVAAAATLSLRGRKRAADAALPAQTAAVAATPAPAPAPVAAAESSGSALTPVAATATPRLLEFGSNRCMTCQQMAVVLDALRASQGVKLQVDFVDVLENPGLDEPYKISIIPTQILFDASGKEIYRHTGFFSHDGILEKFRELGVQL